MKMTINARAKKRAASRPPMWVASTDHVVPPPSVVQRTTSLFVIPIELAMPIRRVTNLPYQYSIYGMHAGCQAPPPRQRHAMRRFVTNFPRDHL
jgi:hypothetical protein